MTQDWRQTLADHARLLERRTGAGVTEWLERIRQQAPADEAALRTWLGDQGVTGYPQQLLVFETLGYPDFLTATSEELIDAQYADRTGLRPVLDRLIEVASGLGAVTVQARKGFVTLQTRRRKFAVIKAASKTRVDLALRTDPAALGGRFAATDPQRSNDMTARAALTGPGDVDAEVEAALRQAYTDNE